MGSFFDPPQSPLPCFLSATLLRLKYFPASRGGNVAEAFHRRKPQRFLAIAAAI